MEESTHTNTVGNFEHILILLSMSQGFTGRCFGGTPKPDGEGLEGGFDYLIESNNPDPMLK